MSRGAKDFFKEQSRQNGRHPFLLQERIPMYSASMTEM